MKQSRHNKTSLRTLRDESHANISGKDCLRLAGRLIRSIVSVITILGVLWGLGIWASAPAAAQLASGPQKQSAQQRSAEAYASEKPSPEQAFSTATVGDSVRVMLKEGRSGIEGVIQHEDDQSIRLKTFDGQNITLMRQRVQSVVDISAAARAQREARLRETHWPDPNRTRLFFGPTARAHPRGQLYLAGHQILFPYAAYGLGNRLNARIGVSALPYQAQFMYGATKIALKRSGHVRLAVGGMGAMTTNVMTSEAGKDEYGGIIYGVMTIEQTESPTTSNAVTVGAGYMGTGGVLGGEKGFAMLGGEYRLSRGFKLLSENYLLLGGGSMDVAMSGGFRMVGGRTSLDIGAFTSKGMISTMTVPVLPMVTVSYAFGMPINR